jgi:hypothetical protein
MQIPDKAPCLDLLPRFTAADVPERGPEEQEIDPFAWERGQGEDATLPGGGMGRHPFLYVGEGCNRIYLVADGRVIWTYDTGKGTELDDVWMLSNGNILFSHMAWCGEVTPDKKRVWYYESPQGSEVHSLQPIGLDRVLMVENAPTPRVMVVNKQTGAVEYEHAIPHDPALSVHQQFRRVRMTASGTLLLPYLSMGQVVEYDRDFHVLWRYETPRPWSCQRLHNGNTLITDERDLAVKEVNPAGQLVWSISVHDLDEQYVRGGSFDRPTVAPDSAPGATSEPIGWQSCVRLVNGNTVLCSQGGYGAGPQFIEVTPQKQVVWALKNWKDLGPATSIQILSDPGVPETPGACQR